MSIRDLNAAEILRQCGACRGHGDYWDFYALPTSSVGAVLRAADAAGYRAPRNANGSRARYFYEALRRQVERRVREG